MMKYIFTSLLFFFSFLSFSQTITFECNNEIITVSFDEITNNSNAYIDWDGDGVINENDYLIYLLDLYGCDNDDNDWGGGDDDNDWGGDDDDNDWGGDDDDNDWGDVFTFDCNGEEITIELTNLNDFIDFESYIDSILSDYDCEEWGDDEDNDWGEDDVITWNDIDWIISDWDDFDWESVWDELELGTFVDWDNIPWDEIIDLNIFTDDFLDYIISIISEGQPFNWDDFLLSQACEDDDAAIIGGLSGIGVETDGCEDAVPYLMSLGFSCSDEVYIPGLGSIMPSDVCCATCEDMNSGGDDVIGCTDSSACNYDSEATVDDGSCDYGVECFVSPCSVSDDPGIEGAYCVDDYCEGCCAFWYYPDGTLISNSCEEEISDDSIVGLWYDEDNDQYIEITEDAIGFYTFIEEFEFICWFYWSMEYTVIGDGLIEVLDPYEGPAEVAWDVLSNGDLEIIVPEGESVVLVPIDELPELDMCDDFSNSEGCEGFQGQWSWSYPGTEFELLWMDIDESGADVFIFEEEECVTYFSLSYDSIEGSDDCTLFFNVYGNDVEFGQLSMNEDGTLSFVVPTIPDWPETWSPSDFDAETFILCEYGCTDPNACNYDPFANIDDGTCGLVDDCGDCQIPYCYTLFNNSVEYVPEDECDLNTSIWIGNDCENNDYCLSSPENLFWNSGCVSLDENMMNKQIQLITNLLGQPISNDNTNGLRLYFYQNGDVDKKQIIK